MGRVAYVVQGERLVLERREEWIHLMRTVEIKNKMWLNILIWREYQTEYGSPIALIPGNQMKIISIDWDWHLDQGM